MSVQHEPALFFSVEQLTCPPWCRSDHRADYPNTQLLADVRHQGPTLEPLLLGGPDAPLPIAGVSLDAWTTEDGKPHDVALVFYAHGGGGEMDEDVTPGYLREQATRLRQHADAIDDFAAQVERLMS